jgi:hypothetical protein
MDYVAADSAGLTSAHTVIAHDEMWAGIKTCVWRGIRRERCNLVADQSSQGPTTDAVAPAQRPSQVRRAFRSPGAGLLVGFQGAIVRVLLQLLLRPRRLIRAIICELSIAVSNPPRPRLPAQGELWRRFHRACHGVTMRDEEKHVDTRSDERFLAIAAGPLESPLRSNSDCRPHCRRDRFASESGHTRLQQPGPRVVPEGLGIAHVAPQHIDRLVTAHVHHLEQRGSTRWPAVLLG